MSALGCFMSSILSAKVLRSAVFQFPLSSMSKCCEAAAKVAVSHSSVVSSSTAAVVSSLAVSSSTA
eukprot:5554467-Pleurochrysis_carterae.AAC.1